jgi:hypothetical protein
LSAAPVYDALSNRNEHIVEAVKAIGRFGGLKCKLFEAVYYHKKRIKTVAELATMTGLTRMQVLQSAGALKKAGIMGQTRKDGDTAYEQIESFQHVKGQILSILRTPSRLKDLPTKRNSAPTSDGPSFVKAHKSRSRRPNQPRTSRTTSVALRIAFLASNPDDEDKLRTDMELKAVSKAIVQSGNRDKVSLKPYPAASFTDLLDALNEFKPQVVHFSGHGGGEGLTFDTEYEFDYEGTHLQFETIARVVSSIDEPPIMLVFNACDTEIGAGRFLQAVKAVIAMSDVIKDESALLFAPRFYAALVSGQSVLSALTQATAVLDAQGFSGSDLPKLLLAPGVEAAKLKLI